MKYFVILSVLVCLLAVVSASSYYAQAAKGSSRRSPAQNRRQPTKSADESGSLGSAAEEEHPAPEPYSFSYESNTDDGAKVERSETGDQSGTITGQYSYMGPDGIFRTVTYTADASGFHPVITSNEPGLFDENTPAELAPGNPADVTLNAQNPPANSYDTPRKGGSKKRKSSRNY